MTTGSSRYQRCVEIGLVIATGALLLLAVGCASLANTPAQDVAWTRWGICHAQAPGTEIRNVQLDGRIRFWYVVPGDRQVMLDCLRQAGSTGPALPEPLADSLPRGA
jgi:hypothetical protein